MIHISAPTQAHRRSTDMSGAAKINPLDLLAKDCTVQTLTVSDQHATLLVTYPEIIHRTAVNNEAENSDDAATSKTISSLLKLTIIPFHKVILGSNPIISAEDIKKGQMPERNSLENNPQASKDIMSFLQKYTFELKSESGAEYSYYAATPTSDLNNIVGNITSVAAEENDKNNTSNANDATTGKDAVSKLFGSFDIELISPATPYQITRAMPSLGHVLIHETPEMYSTIAKPYIKSIVDSGSLSWIANVIEVKKEKERLLVNHEDFIINIDTKWRSHPPPLTTQRKEWHNHPSIGDLYCLGIVKGYDITCLRDLRKEHVPLLKEMEKEGLDAIKTIYGVDKDQIRVFVHYQPQFYHFHVHYTRLENEVGCSVERGHLLTDIIQNLEMDSEYYCKRIVTYKLKKGSPLQNLIENHQSSADC